MYAFNNSIIRCGIREANSHIKHNTIKLYNIFYGFCIVLFTYVLQDLTYDAMCWILFFYLEWQPNKHTKKTIEKDWKSFMIKQIVVLILKLLKQVYCKHSVILSQHLHQEIEKSHLKLEWHSSIFKVSTLM